jgi:FAD synthase
VHGDKIGRQLGFHTANIRIKHERPPLRGVFAVEVKGLPGGPHRGAANLGYRPSANQVRARCLKCICSISAPTSTAPISTSASCTSCATK